MSRTSTYSLLAVVVFVLFCLWPGSASGNIGIPFSVVVLGYYWVLLISVIVVETVILKKRLSLKYPRAIGIGIVVNIASAVLGSFVIFAGDIAFAQAGFEAWYGWPAKVPFYVFLVPSYLISVLVEAAIALPFVKPWSYRNLLREFLIVNLYSYALLAVLGLVITMGPY